MPKNWSPLCEFSPSAFVSMSNAREVKALLMAILMLPIQAPSMRSKATRFAPASTTAMFMGDRLRLSLILPCANDLCAQRRA